MELHYLSMTKELFNPGEKIKNDLKCVKKVENYILSDKADKELEIGQLNSLCFSLNLLFPIFFVSYHLFLGCAQLHVVYIWLSTLK